MVCNVINCGPMYTDAGKGVSRGGGTVSAGGTVNIDSGGPKISGSGIKMPELFRSYNKSIETEDREIEVVVLKEAIEVFFLGKRKAIYIPTNNGKIVVFNGKKNIDVGFGGEMNEITIVDLSKKKVFYFSGAIEEIKSFSDYDLYDMVQPKEIEFEEKFDVSADFLEKDFNNKIYDQEKRFDLLNSSF
jgi:hypothetical protein